MKPIDFPGTVELHRPPGMTEEECGSLPVFKHEGRCISCWELDDGDLKRVAETKKIWLYVFSGQTQPPVSVQTENPFEQYKEEKDG